MYSIIKLAVKDALKESRGLHAETTDKSQALIAAIEKQNGLISLLVADGKNNINYALQRRGGAVMSIKGDELGKRPLNEYDISLLES